MFYLVDETEDLSPGCSTSDGSERLLRTGREGAGLYRSFGLKDQVVRTSKDCCCSVAKSCPTLWDPWSLLRFMSIELVMLSNHLILCCPFLLYPQSFPASRVFFNELAFHNKDYAVRTAKDYCYLKKTRHLNLKSLLPLFVWENARSLGSLKSFIWCAPQLSGASVLYFLILCPLRMYHWGGYNSCAAG